MPVHRLRRRAARDEEEARPEAACTRPAPASTAATTSCCSGSPTAGSPACWPTTTRWSSSPASLTDPLPSTQPGCRCTSTACSRTASTSARCGTSRELARWLRAHKRNRFLLTAPPLRLPGAVGSPADADRDGMKQGRDRYRRRLRAWARPRVQELDEARLAWSRLSMARSEGQEAFAGRTSREDADCRRVAKAVLDKWGRIDALVNNAGTTKFVTHADLEGLSAEDFLRIFRLNVVGAVPDDPRLRAGAEGVAKAAIVNVSSVASLLGTGSSIAYARVEGGARHHDAFARARARAEVRVNVVAPGYVRHALAGGGARRRGRCRARAPLRRARPLKAAPEAQDVAEAIAWLVEGARRVTGEIIYVDGGMHIAPRSAALIATSTTSSSARARPAACWRIVSVPTNARNVLLLEAGPRDTRLLDPRAARLRQAVRAHATSTGPTSPSPSRTLNGRRIFTPRGKVLGGSSSINGLVYIRGQPEDFDAWGMPGWDLRRRCCRTSRRPRQRSSSGLRTSSATRSVRRVHRLGARRSAFRATTISTARPGRHGLLPRDRRATAGARSTAVAYLRPAEKRPNLRVETEALATRVAVRRQAGGRRRVSAGRQNARSNRAAREVILVRRHVQLAAAAAALRRRAARAARAARHPGGARLAGRRRAACRTISTAARSGAAAGRSR